MPLDLQSRDPKILKRLAKALLHQRLSIIRFDAGWVDFQFGPIRQVECQRPIQRSWVGESAIHLICCWRVLQPGGLVTGNRDMFLNSRGDHFTKNEWCRCPNTLAYRRLVEWASRDESFQDRPPGLPAEFHIYPLVARSVARFVTSVLVSEFGDLTLQLSDGSSIETFRDATDGEQWRQLFPHRLRRAHVSMWGNNELFLD